MMLSNLQVKANMKFDAVKPHQSELRVPTVMTNPAHSIEMTAQLLVSSGAINNNVIMLKDTRVSFFFCFHKCCSIKIADSVSLENRIR